MEQAEEEESQLTNELSDLSIHFGTTDDVKEMAEQEDEIENIYLFIQMEYCEGMSLNNYTDNPKE